jgi:hypothetical protein
MTACSQTNITNPCNGFTQTEDPCKGEHVSTACVFKEDGISYLDIPEGASLNVILQNIVAALQASNARIGILETQIQTLQDTCCGQSGFY